MNEIVEALKVNLRRFYALRGVEKAFMEKAGYSNLVFLNDHKGVWEDVGENGARPTDCIFRLRRDYKEEPELVKCEVYIDKDMEQKEGLRFRGKTNELLSYAPDKPDFIGFELGGQLWGRLYKNKEYGTYAIIIDTDKLDKYDVCDMSNAKVLFKGKQ